MILNVWQKAVARTYGGGDYSYLTEQAEVSHQDLEHVGDTLFEFLMVELSDQEDCANQEEAVRRMVQARDQLDNAIAVLEAL